MDGLGFGLITSVEPGEEVPKCVSPRLSVLVFFKFGRQSSSHRGFGWLVEVPVVASGLFEDFVVLAVAPLLFLVFLQTNAVCKGQVGVVVGVIKDVS